MLTYTGRRGLFGDLTNNATATNLTLGDTLMDQATKSIFAKGNLTFLERSDTSNTTVAGTQFYNLPNNLGKLIRVSVIVGNIQYSPREAPSREYWDKINMATTVQANIPRWYFIFNGQIGFWPTPSSSGNTITLIYKITFKDLSIADYTTGTITTATNGSTAIVGSGTTWTAPMGGRYIRITASDTANTGDGDWYEISSVTSATGITLVKNYAGTSIAAGSAAYTLGQSSPLPETYQILPVYWAVYHYFASVNPDAGRAKIYNALFKDLYADMFAEYGSKSTDPAIQDTTDFEEINPNLTLTLT